MMFNKDKTKDRNRRFSESMKEALAKCKEKKHDAPIKKPSEKQPVEKETTKLPNLPRRMRKKKTSFLSW